MTVLETTTYGRNTLCRLRRESMIVDGAVAPALTPAYELDRSSPTAKLVPADVPDITLDDLVGVSPLPAAAALRALHDVAATLQAMHRRGLVHGDLRTGRVYVLPDGRAALAQPDQPPPPVGNAREAARRADTYAFAALACELLAGVRPLTPADAKAMTLPLTVLPPRAAVLLRNALTAKRSRRPRPLGLVADLEAIPADEWMTNRRQRVPPEEAALLPAVEPDPDQPRALEPPARVPVPAMVEPFAPVPTGPVLYRYRVPTSEVVVRVVPTRPRKSVLRRLVGTSVVTLGLLAVFSGGAAGAKLLFEPASAGDPGASPPEVRRVSVSVTPPQAQCPRAAMHVAATITVDGGEGDLVVRWRLPDGSLADTQTVSVDDGDTSLRTAIDLTFAGTEAVVGDVVAIVSPGGIRASAPIRYVCPGANRDDRKSRDA